MLSEQDLYCTFKLLHFVISYSHASSCTGKSPTKAQKTYYFRGLSDYIHVIIYNTNGILVCFAVDYIGR